MIFEVDKNWDEKLMRDFLRVGCRISRNTLCILKKCENGIMLNGKCVTVRATLHTGDKVELAIEDKLLDENPNLYASGVMPEIVYEDDSMLVINKPAGMPTHTSLGHYDDALSNAVYSYLKEQGEAFVFRAINRLDRDTSGVVLIAKNRYYASILTDSLVKGEFTKRYIAVVEGKLSGNGSVQGYIAREQESMIKRCFSTEKIEGGDYSLSYYEVLDANESASLVLVTPVTGRTHQIRLHLASLGHTIIGDDFYGNKSEYISRQALHAYTLSFPSPITGEKITVKAPLPTDIMELCKQYSLKDGE